MSGSPRPVLVDTSIAIASFRRDKQVMYRLSLVQSVLSPTILGELYYGALRAILTAKEMAYIGNLVQVSHIVTLIPQRPSSTPRFEIICDNRASQFLKTICGLRQVLSNTACHS